MWYKIYKGNSGREQLIIWVKRVQIKKFSWWIWWPGSRKASSDQGKAPFWCSGQLPKWLFKAWYGGCLHSVIMCMLPAFSSNWRKYVDMKWCEAEQKWRNNAKHSWYAWQARLGLRLAGFPERDGCSKARMREDSSPAGCKSCRRWCHVWSHVGF